MTRAVHWFRNDLRLRDNTALGDAVARCDELLAVFVLDERLLGAATAGAPRVRFLLDCLARLSESLAERDVPLLVRRGRPEDEIPRLLEHTGAEIVAWNRDTTPFARRRDAAVRARVERLGRSVLERTDRVIFAGSEIRTGSGAAYSVYTPFARTWRRRLAEDPRPARRAPRLPGWRGRERPDAVPTARDLGFPDDGPELPTGGERAARRRLRRFLGGAVRHYSRDRDRPAVDGTSRLSPYLRFGAISARECVGEAMEAAASEPALSEGVDKWVGELAWREFYAAVLEEHPRVLVSPYREEFAGIEWDEDEALFDAWREGRTGVPVVDAGMRQLAATGWMHNRARMWTASFLAKDLLLDWRLGERWFLRSLVDGDPASNDGGWQWSASTGTDAAPWFRIFNPALQGERYDPEGAYVRRWVPELADVEDRWIQRPWESGRKDLDYPPPVVDHAERRELALERYRAAAGSAR